MLATMNISEELKDQLKDREYGEHIYGARKDDYVGMTEAQLITNVKKDKIWKTLKQTEMYEQGYSQGIILFISELRKSITTVPNRYTEEDCRRYRDNVSYVRDKAMAVKTFGDAEALVAECQNRFYVRSVNNRYNLMMTDDCIFSSYPTFRGDAYYLSKSRRQKIGLNNEQKIRADVEKMYSVYPVDSGVTVKDGHIEVRRGGGISFYYPQTIPEFHEGEYLLVSRSGICEVFSTLDTAKAKRDAFIELAIASKKSKTDGKRKGTFKVKDITDAKRTGKDYISEYCANGNGVDPHATGSVMEEVLGFDKGQYGNYVSVNGMIDSLDSTFCAALDLANLLNLPPKFISFNGNLGLAFGARGRSAAAAHYEPDMKVINITYDLRTGTTKPGCFAHEWAHALDNYLGTQLQRANGLTFASESRYASEEMKNLVKTMTEKVEYVTPKAEDQQAAIEKSKRYITSYTNGYRPRIEKRSPELLAKFDELVEKLIASDATETRLVIDELSNLVKEATGHVIQKGVRDQLVTNMFFVRTMMERNSSTEPQKKITYTDYLKGSKEFDAMYSKLGNGYWSSTVELFARAFDCYIEDKLKASGLRSDYLSCHASGYAIDGKFAYPRGEERKLINECFDKLFDRIRAEV